MFFKILFTLQHPSSFKGQSPLESPSKLTQLATEANGACIHSGEAASAVLAVVRNTTVPSLESELYFLVENIIIPDSSAHQNFFYFLKRRISSFNFWCKDECSIRLLIIEIIHFLRPVTVWRQENICTWTYFTTLRRMRRIWYIEFYLSSDRRWTKKKSYCVNNFSFFIIHFSLPT